MDPALLGVGATVSAPLLGYLLRVLRRVDKRTERLDDAVQHHDRTIYGDPRVDDDGGLVKEVRENSRAVRGTGRALADGGEEGDGS